MRKLSSWIIYAVTAFTAISTIAALLFAGYIVNDINNFYDATMEDILEFKVSRSPLAFLQTNSDTYAVQLDQNDLFRT